MIEKRCVALVVVGDASSQAEVEDVFCVWD
jgi:hypothetical protein